MIVKASPEASLRRGVARVLRAKPLPDQPDAAQTSPDQPASQSD